MLKYSIQGSEKVVSPVYSPKTPGGDEVADMILSDNYYDAEDDEVEYGNIEDYESGVVEDDGVVVEDDGVEDEAQKSFNAVK